MKLKTRKSFRRELKRQLKYAIGAGVGLMIAYAWRETIWETAHTLVEKFIDTTKASLSDITTAVLLTIIGVIIILISAKLLKD